MLQDPGKQIVGATVESELAFGPENLGTAPRDEMRAKAPPTSPHARASSPWSAGRRSALSGGERQLVAVAGILMMQPRLYVVVEPLANLDPATASRLLAVLRDLADNGDAVVIVEHRVEEALDLRPDAVLYLDEGRTRFHGPVDSFLEIADPRSVKLPFEVVLDRARGGGLDAPQPPIERLASEAPASSKETEAATPPPDSSSSTSMPRSASTRFSTVSTPGSAEPRSSPCSAPTAPARPRCSGPRCGCCR